MRIIYFPNLLNLKGIQAFDINSTDLYYVHTHHIHKWKTLTLVKSLPSWSVIHFHWDRIYFTGSQRSIVYRVKYPLCLSLYSVHYFEAVQNDEKSHAKIMKNHMLTLLQKISIVWLYSDLDFQGKAFL